MRRHLRLGTLLVVMVPVLAGIVLETTACSAHSAAPTSPSTPFRVTIVSPQANIPITGPSAVMIQTDAVLPTFQVAVDGTWIGSAAIFNWTPSDFTNGQHTMSATVTDTRGEVASANENIIVALPTTTSLVQVGQQTFSDLASSPYDEVGLNITSIPVRGTVLKLAVDWNEPGPRCMKFTLYELSPSGSGPGALVQDFNPVTGSAPDYASVTYTGYNGRRMFAYVRNCSDPSTAPVSGALIASVGP